MMMVFVERADVKVAQLRAEAVEQLVRLAHVVADGGGMSDVEAEPSLRQSPEVRLQLVGCATVPFARIHVLDRDATAVTREQRGLAERVGMHHDRVRIRRHAVDQVGELERPGE